MTREEAIKIIKGLVGTIEFSASQEDALIVAIEALQVMDKAIEVEIHSGEYDVESGIVTYYNVPKAEAVQGEWIECLAYNPDLDADVPYIECDQCGHRPYFGGSYRPKYCEECGARMTPYKGGGTE